VGELADFQWELSGVPFGAGLAVKLATVDGIGRPTVRTQDTDAPGEDGGWAGVDVWGPREVTFVGHATVAGRPADALAALDELAAAWDAQDARRAPLELVALRAQYPGRTVRRLWGRPRRFDTDGADLAVGQLRWSATFYAPDPRWYADTTDTLTLGVDVTSELGGVSAPVTAPVLTAGFAATERPGQYTNQGRADAWPVVRFLGPALNPSVTNLATGITVGLDRALLATDEVRVDCRPGSRQVVLNGSANVSGQLSRASRPDLFRIVPGTQEFRFVASDATGQARCVIEAASAWPTL